MLATRHLMKSPGAAYLKDFARARLITLSRPDAMNTMTVAMLRDLHRMYIEEPHSDPGAVYVVRGEGSRAFCAGGDILALFDGENGHACRKAFYKTEFELDLRVATMPRAQVALWMGHVLGSGVGVSLHGRYRVACDTTRFAMPETQIGGFPNVGSAFVFGKMRLPALGAYLAITGEVLHGADVLHAGLATHYAPAAAFPELQERLLAVGGSAEVGPLLDEVASRGATSVPPFRLSRSLPTIERAFTITPTTSVEDIMLALKKDGSPFALNTLATMERNSPNAMVTTLESYRLQRALFSPADATKGLIADLNIVRESKYLLGDFTVGSTALLKHKSTARPPWQPSTLSGVDVQGIQTMVRRAVEQASVRAADEPMNAKDGAALSHGCEGHGVTP